MFSVYKWAWDHSETSHDLVRSSFTFLISMSKLLLRFFFFGKCYCFVILFHLSRVDLAHLVLYHLSLCCKRKYFDFDHEIMAFTNENWDSLLLGMVMWTYLEIRMSDWHTRIYSRHCIFWIIRHIFFAIYRTLILRSQDIIAYVIYTLHSWAHYH